MTYDFLYFEANRIIFREKSRMYAKKQIHSAISKFRVKEKKCISNKTESKKGIRFRGAQILTFAKLRRRNTRPVGSGGGARGASPPQ